MVQYECKACCKRYERYASYYSHLSLKHKDPKVKCDKCCKLFHTRAQMYSHCFRDQCQAPQKTPPVDVPVVSAHRTTSSLSALFAFT